MSDEITNDAASPYADEVKQFIEEEKEQQEVSPQAHADEFATKMHTETEEEPEELEKLENSPLFEARSLPRDTTFDSTEYDDHGEEFVKVKETKIPITNQDKEDYLEAMLLEVPVELEIPLFDGRAAISCRALSVYERDLVVLASILNTDELPKSFSTLFIDSKLQQFYMAMQVTKVNGRQRDFVSFEHVPGKMEEQARELIEWTRTRVETLPLPTWTMFATALNVFNHKLNKLNELALARNFIEPLGSD